MAAVACTALSPRFVHLKAAREPLGVLCAARAAPVSCWSVSLAQLLLPRQPSAFPKGWGSVCMPGRPPEETFGPLSAASSGLCREASLGVPLPLWGRGARGQPGRAASNPCQREGKRCVSLAGCQGGFRC